MKKILTLMITMLIVMAAVGGATFAVLYDQESSQANSLTVGTLALAANGGYTAVTTFSASNVYPGKTGSGSNTLTNTGSLPGALSISSSALTHAAGAPFADITPTDSLYTTATMGIYMDIDQSNSFNANDIGLKSDGTIYNYASGNVTSATGSATVVGGVITGITVSGSGYNNTVDVVSITDTTGTGALATVAISGGVLGTVTVTRGGSNYTSSPTIKVLEYSIVQQDVMNNYASKAWGPAVTMLPGITNAFHVNWVVPSGATNTIEGGTASVNFTFTLNQ